MSIRIYVEGGSPGVQTINCRRAFKSFVGKVIPEAQFKIIACGDRRRTFDAFKTAIESHPDDQVVLLVDSEEAVVQGIWEHLAERVGDGWKRPTGIEDDQTHLMVQVMESWFLADPACLAGNFGAGFSIKALPRQKNLEDVPKLQVYSSLNKATSRTKKACYHKTRDGFTLLGNISPQLVRKSFPHAESFFSALERFIAP